MVHYTLLHLHLHSIIVHYAVDIIELCNSVSFSHDCLTLDKRTHWPLEGVSQSGVFVVVLHLERLVCARLYVSIYLLCRT